MLEWLRTEPQGLTQLDALQHLAVARLAAVIYRLREDDGHTITTELVEMPTRYGPAMVARYHLAEPQPAAPLTRVPSFVPGGPARYVGPKPGEVAVPLPARPRMTPEELAVYRKRALGE